MLEAESVERRFASANAAAIVQAQQFMGLGFIDRQLARHERGLGGGWVRCHFDALSLASSACFSITSISTTFDMDGRCRSLASSVHMRRTSLESVKFVQVLRVFLVTTTYCLQSAHKASILVKRF